MEDILRLIIENDAVAKFIAAGIVLIGVQAVKFVWGLPPGLEKGRKIGTAIVLAVLVAWAQQHLQAEFSYAELIETAILAWLAAAGAHGIIPKMKSSDADRRITL